MGGSEHDRWSDSQEGVLQYGIFLTVSQPVRDLSESSWQVRKVYRYAGRTIYVGLSTRSKVHDGFSNT